MDLIEFISAEYSTSGKHEVIITISNDEMIEIMTLIKKKTDPLTEISKEN